MKAKWFLVILMVPVLLLISMPLSFKHAYAGAGHDLPPSDIGDRQAFLRFNSPSIASASDTVAMSYSLIDEAADKNIMHVTYFLTVINPDGQKVFSNVLHGHEGTVNVEFKPGDEGQKDYQINANYDNLAASYVADQAGLITVVGPVFDAIGTYDVNIEVSGIDFDNTFLPEPLKYSYALAVAETQRFDVQYQDMTFNVGVGSPSEIEEVVLKPESRQLIIQYPPEWQHFDNFQVYVDIPNEMMSGPFTAVFNGMELEVNEEKKDDKTTTLLLNGTHLDVMQTNDSMESMDGMDMSESSDPQNAIVITAASVVPEFPMALPVAAVALASAIVIVRKVKNRASY